MIDAPPSGARSPRGSIGAPEEGSQRTRSVIDALRQRSSEKRSSLFLRSVVHTAGAVAALSERFALGMALAIVASSPKEAAMRAVIRRPLGALLVTLALLAPGAASAQLPIPPLPIPQIQIGPRGITITAMPGVTPVFQLPGTFGPMQEQPAPIERAAPFEPPSFEPPAFEPPSFEPPAFEAAEEAPLGTGRTVGVFVGISDYPTQNDLEYCASDAARVQQAFVNAGIMAPADTVVLTDHRATRAAVTSAIDRLTRQLGRGDMLVFFFSGHGNRVSDQDGDELDGLDETIALYDGGMSDDELAALLAQGPQRELVALDSCYSGGFQRDIARLSDSAGLYASREDQLSYVASEHQAGGYLSHYLAGAIAGSRGRPLSMGELHGQLASGFADSQTAGRQDLTIGVSREVSYQTVLFARDAAADSRLASIRYVPPGS